MRDIMVTAALPSNSSLLRLFLCFTCFICLISCTIVPDEKESDGKEEKLDIYFVNDDFNPDTFVDKIWDKKIVPFFMQNDRNTLRN